jgi:hypothetical protein
MKKCVVTFLLISAFLNCSKRDNIPVVYFSDAWEIGEVKDCDIGSKLESSDPVTTSEDLSKWLWCENGKGHAMILTDTDRYLRSQRIPKRSQ